MKIRPQTLAQFRFDGTAALMWIISQSDYETAPQAIAALSLFTHPNTVCRLQKMNVFLIVRTRNTLHRGEHETARDRPHVMLDDNKGPTDAFLWANGLKRGRYANVHFNHVWKDAQNLKLYTNLANICLTPSFLTKLTDTDPEIHPILKYRAFKLYDGFKPENAPDPIKPACYDDLEWADPLPEVQNLEEAFREAMRTKPKDRTTKSARELGWFFSGFKPDAKIAGGEGV